MNEVKKLCRQEKPKDEQEIIKRFLTTLTIMIAEADSSAMYNAVRMGTVTKIVIEQEKFGTMQIVDLLQHQLHGASVRYNIKKKAYHDGLLPLSHVAYYNYDKKFAKRMVEEFKKEMQ